MKGLTPRWVWGAAEGEKCWERLDEEWKAVVEMLVREAPLCCGSAKTLICVDRGEMDLGIKFFTATSNILLWSPQMSPCFLCRDSSVRPSRNKDPVATRTVEELCYSLFWGDIQLRYGGHSATSSSQGQIRELGICHCINNVFLRPQNNHNQRKKGWLMLH